jgi:hypothetical protein
MVLTVVWICWLAFIVHQWRLTGTTSNAPTDQWQRRTFKWWPVLFGEYNISLSGQYITFLPPIVLKATVSLLLGLGSG